MSERAAAHPVIELERIDKRFGDAVAVRDTSLRIRRGELFSLLGPSGCGKTTLLRLVAGFEEPSRGVVRLDGRDVTGVPPQRRPVNTVFQSYALFPHLSVSDNVAFGPRVRAVPRAERERRVREMLEVVRLGELADRRPSQLSGGQRQRVALARALVNDPSAVLLDEPLSALDRELRQQMQAELARIQRTLGITFLLVTHDQEEALAMSDRLAVMRAGRLEQVGTPEELYHAPASAFVAGFLGGANLIRVTVEKAGSASATIVLPGGGRCETATGGRAFEAGAGALLMVRPERLELAARAPAPGLPGFAVTCTEVVFQGPVRRCTLRDPAGHELTGHLAASRPAPALAPGAALWASWEPEAARLLAAEP